VVGFVVVGRHTCTERERRTHAHMRSETHTRALTHTCTHTEREREREREMMMMFGGNFRVLGDGRWFCGGWDLGPRLGVVGGWPSICK
jgi:hypothetical protein